MTERTPGKRTTAERQANEARGRQAEWLAAQALKLKGMRILAQRYRTPAGEIDIIAQVREQTGDVIAFTEVKAAKTDRAGLEAVTARQQQRIINAAALWLADNDPASEMTVRFDVVLVRGLKVTHMPDSFRPE